MRIERKWAMPNKWTFTIKPIRELLNEEIKGGIYVDPFAGMNSPAQITNDLNPTTKSMYHLDALSFLTTLQTDSADGVLFDPPYSITQAAVCYQNYGKDKLKVNVANMGYWAACKNEVARIVKNTGKVISFGWSTNAIGLKRGFTMTRILIVAHGGSKNDTLVTVETKN